MLKAKDLMTRDVITVTPQTEITEIAKLLLESHFNGVPVVDPDGSSGWHNMPERSYSRTEEAPYSFGFHYSGCFHSNLSARQNRKRNAKDCGNKGF